MKLIGIRVRRLITMKSIRGVLFGSLIASACFVMVLPLVWAVASSIKPLDEVYAFPPSFWANDPQWTNYAEAATRLPLFRFLLNSLVISISAATGAVLTSSMAGYALARFSFRGRTLCMVIVIASMLMPTMVLLIPRYVLFSSLGWVGTYKPLIVPAWLGGGAFNILLFRQFFRRVPRELDEAAMLDGATPWQTYWNVLLPAVRPATVTAALLSFVIHWREFLDPLIYLSDFQTFPISLGLRMYQSLSGTWMNLLMAASVVALVPVFVLFVVGEKWLLVGLGVVQEERKT